MNESLTSSQQQPAVGSDRPPVLLVNNIEVIYDHVILVLKGVSLEVPEGGIVALLGANGAGKTTTLKAISNLLRAERGDVTKGSIEFAGERVDRLTPNDLVKRGVIQVMEGRHCFEHLTIEENLLTGSYTRGDGRAAIQQDLARVWLLLDRFAHRAATLVINSVINGLKGPPALAGEPGGAEYGSTGQHSRAVMLFSFA